MRNAINARTAAEMAMSTSKRTALALGFLGFALALGGCTAPVDAGSTRSFSYPTGGNSTSSDPTSSGGTTTGGGATASGDDAGAPTVDPAPILAAIADGGYRSSAFVHVTETPYPSSVATGSTIDEWVSTLGASDYLAISPDGGAVSANMPPGATIVRAVIDGTGAVSELTLLVKGPPGFNPTIGDWWWGVTDPQGVPQTTDAGLMLGQLTQCYTCHVPHQAEDYLFGAPLNDRAPITDAGMTTASDAGTTTTTTDAGMDSGMDASTDSGSGGGHHHGGGGGGGGGN